MNYRSGDAALLAGLSQVRLNQLFARSAASGGIPLGNLYGPTGAQRQYDHIDSVILALACAVADGSGAFAGPPMRDIIVALDNARDVISDLFAPEISAHYTPEDITDPVAMAAKERARIVAEERSERWTDRGADCWLALVLIRYGSMAGYEIKGEIGLHSTEYGSISQISAKLAGVDAK